MDDASFFDKIAPSWDENEILSTPEKVNMFLNNISVNIGDSVLDLGTGTGVLLPYLAERIGPDGKITAVDFSEGMLRQAKKKYYNLKPEPEFLHLDFEKETIPGEFDKIILYCVYPHLHNPVDTIRWLEKVNLKKEGKLIIAFPCDPETINNIHEDKHSDSDKLPSASKLKEYLCTNGFKAEVKAESKELYIVEILHGES